MDLKSGTIFHDLTLIREIGSGAYGQVWLCRDITGRQLALKVIRGSRQNAELKGIAALRKRLPVHPGIIPIYHIAGDDECLWYTMEPADSAGNAPEYKPDTLAERIHAGTDVPVFPVLRELIAGLAALHDAGMVHRDVKPDNILFIQGHAVLGDLGMVTEDRSSMSLAGTYSFLPPELRSGSRSPGGAGKAGDVYALGMVLYCMFTRSEPENFPSLPKDLNLTPTIQRLNRLVCRICEPRPILRITDLKTVSSELEKIEKLKDSPDTLAEKLKAGFFRLLRKTHTALVLLAGIGGALLFAVFRQTTPDYPGKNGTYRYHATRTPVSMDVPVEWSPISARTMKGVLDSRTRAERDAILKKYGADDKSCEAYEKVAGRGLDTLILAIHGERLDMVQIHPIKLKSNLLNRLNDEQLRVMMTAVLRQKYGEQAVVYSMRRSEGKVPVLRMEFSLNPERDRSLSAILLNETASLMIMLTADKELYGRYTEAFDRMISTAEITRQAEHGS